METKSTKLIIQINQKTFWTLAHSCNIGLDYKDLFWVNKRFYTLLTTTLVSNVYKRLLTQNHSTCNINMNAVYSIHIDIRIGFISLIQMNENII